MSRKKRLRFSCQGKPHEDLQYIINSDGQHIYCKYWQPPEGTELRAGLLFLHGIAEHCERYDTFATKLAESGIFVFSHDHVGHGKSEGRRTDIREFSVYVRDALQHADLIRAKLKNHDIPMFIGGQSLGALIAMLCMNASPNSFRGAILLSPLIRSNYLYSSRLQGYISNIMTYLYPQYKTFKIEGRFVSRDVNKAEEYDQDKLIWHGGIRARTVAFILQTQKRIESELRNITWSFIAFHGNSDVYSNVEGSKMLHSVSQSEDKTLQIFEDAYHSLLHDQQHASPITDEVLMWIRRHSKV